MNLSKQAVLDPRIEVSQSFKRWFTMLGANDINTYLYPTTTFNQSNIVFNITMPNNLNTVIDRHSAILSLPVTMTMTGTGVGTGNIFQPNREGLRCRPFDKICTSMTFNLNGTSVSYQSNELSLIQSVFQENKENAQYIPTMVDPGQSYSAFFGSNRSPFALMQDNVKEITRRAYPITVVSNTTSAATLQFTLFQNLFDWSPFSADPDCVGISIYPFTISFTMVGGYGLQHMWSRDPAHSQNLSGMSITFGQPQISMTAMSLPQGVNLPRELTYEYHKSDYYPTNIATPLAQFTTQTVTSQLIELQTTPLKIYVYVKPSTNNVLSSLANSVNFTDSFAQINSHRYIFATRTNLLANQTPIDMFHMTKRNGLPDKFGWVDWWGQCGSNPTNLPGGDPLLMGGIVCLDPVKDLGGECLVGLLKKQQFQATLTFTTLNPTTTTYDLGIIIVYDGFIHNIDGRSEVSTTVMVSPDELQLSPMSYNQLKSLVGGSRVSDFFKTHWGTIKNLASPILDFLRQNNVISNVASMIPYANVAAPMIRRLGYGDEGGWIGGEDGDDGDDGDDGGVLAGGRRLTRAQLRKNILRNRR